MISTQVLCLGASSWQPRPSTTQRPSRSPLIPQSWRLLLVLLFLTFIQVSHTQLDPIRNFCRIFGHQTAVIDNRLYIDGGFINYNPISQYPANYTSERVCHPAAVLSRLTFVSQIPPSSTSISQPSPKPACPLSCPPLHQRTLPCPPFTAPPSGPTNSTSDYISLVANLPLRFLVRITTYPRYGLLMPCQKDGNWLPPKTTQIR